MGRLEQGIDVVPFVLWIDFETQIHTLFFMGVCVLVTSGENFDVDEYLRESPFKPQQIYRRGEIPSKDNPEQRPLTESGFTLLVSQDEYPQLIEQVVHALRYWEEELQWLTDAGADKMLLDFGITEQTMLQRPQYLPPELISAMSRFEMGLVFSIVPQESH